MINHPKEPIQEGGIDRNLWDSFHSTQLLEKHQNSIIEMVEYIMYVWVSGGVR